MWIYSEVLRDADLKKKKNPTGLAYLHNNRVFSAPDDFSLCVIQSQPPSAGQLRTINGRGFAGSRRPLMWLETLGRL